MKTIAPASLIMVALFAFAVSGCGTSSTEQADSSTATADAAEHGDHDHGDHAAGGQTDMEKMEAELAKLAPEDAASAKKQHFCPVSGDMLGVMWAPKKVEVNGQQVWICCEDCEQSLLDNPEEYLAKLKKE